MAVISGDGIFSHVFLGAKDTSSSSKFYDAALAPFGVKNMGPFGEFVLYGKDKPAFISSLGNLAMANRLRAMA